MSEFKVFISYRRTDTRAIAYRIHQSLCDRFGKGNVFIDGRIEIGNRFTQVLKEHLEKSHVVLAIVGENWLGKSSDGKVRLNEATDFVRYEIETAMELAIPIVPVLIDGAKMPDDNLVFPLNTFKTLQAVKVDAGPQYEEDIKKLIDSLPHHAGRSVPISIGIHDRCKHHQEYQDLFPAALKAEMALDQSDLFLLLLNAIEPNQCSQVRAYFRGRHFPGRELVGIEGIYDLFGRFEFLIKLRVPGDDPKPIDNMLADLRGRRLLAGAKTNDAILLNVTRELYPQPPLKWVPLDEARRAVKAFLHIYPWDPNMQNQFVDTCHRAADHGISTVGVFVASSAHRSELVAEYYSGCGSYYDQVRHILEVEDALLRETNRNALLVMKVIDEKRPPSADHPVQPQMQQVKSSHKGTARSAAKSLTRRQADGSSRRSPPPS
jgi:hypothetical protein